MQCNGLRSRGVTDGDFACHNAGVGVGVGVVVLE